MPSGSEGSKPEVNLVVQYPSGTGLVRVEPGGPLNTALILGAEVKGIQSNDGTQVEHPVVDVTYNVTQPEKPK